MDYKLNKRDLAVLTVLLSGKPVTKDEFETTLGSEIHFYRLPTYIWRLKYHGVQVKVHKDGRNVTAYEITNLHDAEILRNQLTLDLAKKSAAKPAKTIQAKIAKISNPKIVAQAIAANAKAPIIEIPEENTGEMPVIDPDFDHVDVSDIIE